MKMNIVYVSSEEYAKFAYASILSLLENNKNVFEIRIYFIEENIHKKTKSKLIRLIEKYNREIVFLKAHDIYEPIRSIKSITTHHNSLNIYASLFLTKIRNIDRVLLIESDVIINGPIIDLYNVEMNECFLSGLMMMLPSKYHIFDRKYPWYINGGIILFDLKKLRENDSEQKIIKYFKTSEYKESSESALYALFKNKILPMHPKYHLIPEVLLFKKHEREYLNNSTEYYSYQEYYNAQEKPIMIHYASSYFGRPWDINCYHPYKDIFIKYYEQVPWESKYIKSKQKTLDYIIKFLYRYRLLFRVKKCLHYFKTLERVKNEN